MKSATIARRLAFGMLSIGLAVAGSAAATASDSKADRARSAITTQPSTINGNGVKAATELNLTLDQQQQVEGQVSAQLAMIEGSQRVSFNEVAWQEGSVKVVITFAVPGFEVQAADCPFQWVCVYDAAGFGYPRQAYFNCGNAATPSWVSSWHNNQTNATQSWLMNLFGANQQGSLAPSRISYVGDPANDVTRFIHVC